jgi:Holin of 3TMs, for gene-transfer release
VIKRLDSSNISSATEAPLEKVLDPVPAAPMPPPQPAAQPNSPNPYAATPQTTATPTPAVSVSTTTTTITPTTTASSSSTTNTLGQDAYSYNPDYGSIMAGADASDFDKAIANRKMLLEEARFKLEDDRERNKMLIELKKEEFREKELAREGEENAKKQSEHWMKSYWRPAMGWLYMLMCACDFIVFPFMTMGMPVILKSFGLQAMQYTQWQSLTLQNGGLIHLAFGAILGIAAWTRGQEKIAKMG